MTELTPEDLAARFYDLTDHRRNHIQRVVDTMNQLCDRHGLDEQAGYYAAWGHDLAREMRRPELLGEAGRLGLPLEEWAVPDPLILHGPIAAKWLELAGLGRSDAWQAIAHHTTAGARLTPIAQALFIADGIEPGRSYAERVDLERMAYNDLTGGYQAVLKHTAAYLTERGLVLHPHMLAALAECDATRC